MVYWRFAFDIPLKNGSNLEAHGECGGTLLTGKIILTAAHCCKPGFRIGYILPLLFPDYCGQQKCYGRVKDCLVKPKQPGCEWLSEQNIAFLPMECQLNQNDRQKCKELIEKCGPQYDPRKLECKAINLEQLRLLNHGIESIPWLNPGNLPEECRNVEEKCRDTHETCQTALNGDGFFGCDKRSELMHYMSKRGQLLNIIKEGTVEAG